MGSVSATYPPSGGSGGGGGGITQLTGDVTAGPGTGSLVATIAAGIVPRTLSAQWLTADGTTKTITHNWGSRKIIVEVLDNSAGYITIWPDATRPTTNTVVLTSSEAPASAWTVLLSEVIN